MHGSEYGSTRISVPLGKVTLLLFSKANKSWGGEYEAQ